jgi:hypothetical protein
MRSVPVALLLMSLTPWGGATGQDGCGRFGWSLKREVELFGDGYMPVVESTAWLPREGAFRLKLDPVATAFYAVTPERGRDDGYGGSVTLQWISAGRYQITLSDDVWLDAIQAERRLPLLATSHRADCPNIRLTIQVEVDSKPLTPQVGGAQGRLLDIAILRVR